MELKYISPYKILYIYGLFGTILYSIICTITSIFECKDSNEPKNISDYLCSYNDTNKNKTYFASFPLYFKAINEFGYLYVENIVIILGMILFFFYKYYQIMIIKYLSPIHLIFLTPIYYFFAKVLVIVYNLILKIFNKCERFLKDPNIDYIKEKFYLDISGDIFSFFAFLIYLEIIELSFLKLNENLRKNIIARGTKEASIIGEDGIIDEDDDEDDE